MPTTKQLMAPVQLHNSQVQGATDPCALPVLALKTPSMQKLLCNSQFKLIPDLILSLGAKHFFFSHLPNTITHCLIFLPQSH